MLLLAFSGSLCLAQESQPADDFKPASSNQPGRQYPQVNSKGRVRVRIVAPDAHSILLGIGAVKYPITNYEGVASGGLIHLTVGGIGLSDDKVKKFAKPEIQRRIAPIILKARPTYTTKYHP